MRGRQRISRRASLGLLSFGRQIVSGFCVFLASCTLFQPPPAVVERTYEGDSITKRVRVGRDFNLWPPLTETHEHARERLLTSISQECPHYRVLAEGSRRGPEQ
jgi:hypothetical protein